MKLYRLSKLNSIIYFLFFLFSSLTFGQILTSRTPKWIDFQTFENNPDIDKDAIAYGTLKLLSDEQIHIPNQERYLRTVTKITDNTGIQSSSLISINYDPSYQKLYLHEIIVIRNNKKINKLSINDFQTIRKEANSENHIYDGSLNATANLSDIRKDDVLDISYTIKGFNPLKKKFSGAFILNDYQPIGKINVNLLSEKKLNFKLFNTENKPIIKSKLGLTSYNWIAKNTAQQEFEENTAMWHLSYHNLFVSEYNDWGQVVNWALPVYTSDKKISTKLSNKIEAIKKTSVYERNRIKLALKFVQNEIRYLGLESGIGAYKPFKPNKVFEQRFGDCKDKSWLLVNMLRAMDIEAYPVLINTVYGKSLNNFLPTPGAFDHVIVKVIDSTKTGRFFDPTITNQEGSFESITLPNYNNGLVLKKGNTKLEAIENNSEDLVEIFDTFDVNGIGGDLTLNVVTVYNGGEADQMRSILKSSSIKSLNKEFRDYYKNFYDEVEILNEMIVEDDSLYNKVTIEESYRFDNVWEPMIGNENQIGVNFSPYSLYNNITFPTEKKRKTPFALYYPIHKIHNITIKLPTSWGLKSEVKNIYNKNFNFSFSSKTNRKKDILYLKYEYKNKTQFVSPDDFDTFYEDCKEIENNFSYYIFIPKSYSSLYKSKKPKINNGSNKISNDSNNSSNISIGFIAIILLGILGLIIYIIINNRKYK